MASENETSNLEDLKLFAGPNADEFVEAWLAGKGRGRAQIFWVGFLAPIAWFLYRKMYIAAAAIVVVPLAIGFLFQSETLSKALGFAVSYAGARGRQLYVRSAMSTISRIRSSTIDDHQACREITKAGGVSISGAVIGVLITIAMIVLAVAAGRIKH